MNLSLRQVEHKDSALLMKWRNHPDTYKYFHAAHPVTPKEHKEWLQKYLRAEPVEGQMIFMIEDDGIPVAAVRFDPIAAELGHYAEVSVTVDPEKRGKGYGTMALKIATEAALSENGLWYVGVYATILRENKASLAAFERAGYVPYKADVREIVMLAGGSGN